MDETNYECFPNRKLKFICDKNKIPVSLNPTRDELLHAINGFYSEQPKVQATKNNRITTPHVKQSKGRRIIHSPHVINNSKRSPSSLFGIKKEQSITIPCNRSPKAGQKKSKNATCFLVSKLLLILFSFIFLLCLFLYFI